MKAVSVSRYGTPIDVLTYEDIPRPEPKENEVLVKVMATSVNDYDWSVTSGKPAIYRLIFGIFKPRIQFPGMELSGVIESVGSAVKDLKVGDQVMGDISDGKLGTYAEYVCVIESVVFKKPDFLSFPEATAIPHASALAYQGLFKLGKVKNGEKILINGAGGGVGSWAVQFAKLHNCEVTGIDTSEKFDSMKSLGYDKMYDYRDVDYTKHREKYDLILDCKSKKSVFKISNALKPQGRYVTIGGDILPMLGVVFMGSIVSLLSKKKYKLLALKANQDMDVILDLYKKHRFKCVIDGPYPLNEAGRFVQYFGEGKHVGKVVMEI